MNWLSLITGGLSSIVSGIVQPWFAYKTKIADTDLEAFKVGAPVDVEAYKAYLGYQQAMVMAQLQQQANPIVKVLMFVVGFPACLHAGAVYAVSTFGLNWSVQALPADYLSFQKEIIGSLFVYSIVKAPASALATYFHRS